MINGSIVQKIHNSVIFKIVYKDLTDTTNDIEDEENQFIKNFVNSFIKPFDFNTAPLLRVSVAKFDEQRHLLLIDVHHIITDGVSNEIIQNEFVQLYAGNKLERVNYQYKDYLFWLKSINNDKDEEHKKYWTQVFKKPLPELNLPTDYKRERKINSKGSRFNFNLNSLQTASIRKIAEEEKSTIFLILFAAYNILISKLAFVEDLLITTPSAGRRHEDLGKIVGVFVNTVSIRNQLEKHRSFVQFLKEVKQNTLEAIGHQEYPFVELVDKLAIFHDTYRNPLFEIMFSMQNTGLIAPNRDLTNSFDINIEYYDVDTNKSVISDINLSAEELDDILILIFEYNTNLFKHSTMEKISRYFLNIIDQIIDNRNIILESIQFENEFTELDCNNTEEASGDFEF